VLEEVAGGTGCLFWWALGVVFGPGGGGWFQGLLCGGFAEGESCVLRDEHSWGLSFVVRSISEVYVL